MRRAKGGVVVVEEEMREFVVGRKGGKEIVVESKRESEIRAKSM